MIRKEIERSLLTSYRKTIFRPFSRALQEYNLVEENDSICVCISGGKDSLVMAKCMQELQRHGKYHINCKYVVMDPGYSSDAIKAIEENIRQLGIDVEVFKTDIFERVKNSGHKSPCYVCAKMRRGTLYDYAQKNGCNKIALGHHFDDAIETTMLSLLYNGRFNTMRPIVASENFEGMHLIRPMYLVREKSIQNFVNRWNINCKKCSCPLSGEDTKRKEMKLIIEKLKANNKFVDYNIFRSAENVEIDHVRGVIKDKKHYTIEEFFDKY